MQISGLDLIAQFESVVPKSLALPGDPVGIQLGNPRKTVSKVLVTLDVRPETVAEAVDAGCDMIFAHHPAMFVPAKNMDLRDPQHAMYANILRHDLLVYGAHTNLDNAHPGMNDWLAEKLGLTGVRDLATTDELDGMGRIGHLPTAMTLGDFITLCKNALNLTGLRAIANDITAPVQTVAVLGGSAARTFTAAQAAGADVYVTGDVSYHVGHDMLAANMPVLDVGHHVEQIMKQHVADWLQQWATANEWDLDVQVSTLNTDPFTFC